MGKASRIRQQSAREKIAAQRAAAQRAQRRNRILITAGSVVVVLAVVGVLVGIKLGSGGASSGSSQSKLSGSQLTSVVHKVTTVPASTLASVGSGTSAAKTLIPVTGAAPLTSKGKPEVLYLGAEYCPFCATERWAMAVALSRFGTFHGVGAIHSSPSDVPASIPTLTFYKSSYTSKYVTFTPVETEAVNRQPLQKPTAEQQALVTKYDAAPYVPASAAGSIPFMDFGGKWVLSGASYSYSVLQNKSWSQIATALQTPGNAISQGANGSANMMTAAICKLTNNQPSNVCGTSLIKNLQGKL